MKKTDYKTKVINEISFVKDDDTLQKLYSVVHKFLEDNKKEGSKPSFEEWNKQFDDDYNLDDFIPEYGMTLREFRTGIYEAELSGEEMSIDEFREKIQRW